MTRAGSLPRGLRTAAMLAVVAFGATALPGCGERSQDMDVSAEKDRPAAWRGTDNGYTAPGWKAGDAQSWDEQMRRRAQGQNEYTRIGGVAG